MNKSIDKKKNK